MNELTKKGFMPHNDGRFRFPGSRDFMLDHIPCQATTCICNTGGLCFAPSRCKINEEGKCSNYTPRRVEKKNYPNIRGL